MPERRQLDGALYHGKGVFFMQIPAHEPKTLLRPSAPPKPVAVPALPPPETGRSWSKWAGLSVVITLAAAGWYFWSNRQQSEEKALATRSAIRTASVTSGTVTETLRLTGATAAERFVSLITPQLRGNRGGGGGGDSRRGGGSTFQASMSGSSGVSGGSSSRSGGSSSSVSSSSGSGDSSSVASSSSSASAGGSSGGRGSAGSSAFKAATTRGGSSKSSSSSRSSGSSASAAAASAALGGEGLGSTSGSLLTIGTSGSFGSSGGDFMLVLQQLVKPGSRVSKGEVVAEFDRQYMLQRLEDYRSSVTQVEASYKKLVADLGVYRAGHRQTILSAEAVLEKAKLDMKTVPVLSAIDAERVKLALDEAQAQLKQLRGEIPFVEASEKAQLKFAELDVRESQLDLRKAEMNADRMLLKAPIDGMTVMQNTFKGSEFTQIQQGDQLYPGQFFMQIVEPSSMVVNASLNQVDAERLKIGSKARVRFDAYPGLELPAHVVGIAAVTRTGGFRATYLKEIPVLLKLDKMDPRVIPDLSVSVDVEVESEEGAAIAPLAAVVRETGTGDTFVFVQGSEGYERRKVELGLASNLVAVFRSGLKAGEIVALETPPGGNPPKG